MPKKFKLDPKLKVYKEKNKEGHPTLYRPEYALKAFKFALLGLTDKEMADVFDVDPQTFYNWQKQHPEFLESVHRGKGEADAEIAHSLYRRAKGYSHSAVKIFMTTQNGESVAMHEPYEERYPPDTGAAKHWLSNRTRKNASPWADRQEVTGADGGPIVNVNLNTADPVEAAKAYAKVMGEG